MSKHRPIPISSIRPNVANTALTAISHATNVKWIAEHPRQIIAGPQGISTSGEEQWAQYNGHIRWPFVDGDVTSAKTLEGVFIMPYTSNPIVEVRADFIATHLVKDWWDPEITLEKLRQNRSTASWDVTMEALHFDNGDADWSAATVLASDAKDALQFQHWPTDPSGIWPFLQQMGWTKHGDAIDYSLTYREGQLHAADIAAGLITSVKFTLDITGWTADPILFRLKALRDTGVTPVYGVPHQETDEHLRLSLVAISGLEVPE